MLGGSKIFENYTPKASATTSALHTTTIDSTKKKTSKIELRISYDVVEAYKELCAERGDTVSDALRKYILSQLGAK